MNFAASEQQPTLEQLDTWCEQALSSPTAELREEAERRLRYYFPTFSETPAEISGSHGFSSGQERVLSVFPSIKGPADAANLMTWFLHQSSKVFSITYVVRRLKTLVLNHLSVLSNDQKTELRNSLFSAIREKFADMPAFLIEDTSRALALVVMFTWFDIPDSKDIIDTILELGKPSDKHEILALQMMRAFVEEFNHELPSKYIARQRRVVVTFRDKQLRSMFEHALSAMREAISALSTAASHSDNTDITAKRIILSNTLLLQRDCLAFDFIGLAPDDASDDAVAIQIPSSWKDIIQVDNFLDPYFEGYKHSDPPASSQFIEVLVVIASIRRSFYMEAVRTEFVKRMSAGIVEILVGAIGLEDVENYHHLCRLLARFRCIHTLVEIEEYPVYRELLVATASFTMTGLSLWEWSANSIAPLLTFWSKVASSYDSRDSGNAEIAGDVIADTLPRIIREYLRAMIQTTLRFITGESMADNPLENSDALLENLALVANIARSSYEICAPVLIEILREMAGKYQSMLNSGAVNEEAITVIENQLALPVYAVAQCIGARQPYKSLPDDDRLDAEMFATGLELDRLVQQRLQSAIAAPASEALELAFIQLYYNFRASYIGEQGYKVTAVFAKLSSFVGINDSSGVLDLVLQKVLFNFRTWPSQSSVMQKSLQLFHELTTGYVSVRQVAKLDTMKFLLANHSSDQFQFLRSIDEYKQRSLYYGGLARVLFTNETSASQFAEFMQPWSRMTGELLAMPDAQFSQETVRAELIRVLRDLRGFLSAISSKANYLLFFEWMCPTRIQIIHRSVQMATDTRVQVAALKFMAEFVYNRTQRLNFDVSSANGILIFREASKAMWVYGSGVMESGRRGVLIRDIYKERYKGVAVCFNILMRLVSGKYVAIGVMPLYGDEALEQAYRIMLELLKQFPVADVIAYPKLGKATMTMLEVLLSKSNIDLLPLDEVAYEQVMRLCVEAFDHAETAVSSAACSVIDSALTAAIEGMTANKQTQIVELVQRRKDVVSYLLKTMLNIVLFEDRPNDWSFSRPLFCLIVLDRELALQHTSQVVQYQPTERREELVKALKDLLSATEFVLVSNNRDEFTQALTQYRREVTSKNLILMVPTTQTLGAPVDILGSGSDVSGENGQQTTVGQGNDDEEAMAD
ncbi:hypothetical protein GGI25_003389 [Coemansia spiralis]|uniref:Exportin-7/Ran-binding protein 17 TPR repeats domain-containing protein n=2 Tax=Coemansia TaxID=4863 RepID=A0A9W8G6W3_9FUNG|nr:hypothetical protein EDC05_003778 [Coemansia umbellata]KAJ2621707.1 hypothetical protein GGI26_003915 [Coemansia sp. RSA 1358]KAJ2676854.1 hypothetical protein GGI25_003389 [Coemansia spiralis]